MSENFQFSSFLFGKPLAKNLFKNSFFNLISPSEKSDVLIITHYQRLLDYIKPDFVHVLINGKIVKSGGPDLALELEKKGYENFK